MKKQITALMIAKNEDRFIWYAIKSVLPFVDKFIIFDTGSSDKTISVINSIKSPKINFVKKKKVSPALITSYRQEQINLVKSGWLWLVDADEIYPTKTALAVVSAFKSLKGFMGVIIHRYDLLGDVYHYQRETVGSYNQFGKIGHFVLRALDKDAFPGLEVKGFYPREYFAEKGHSVKERGKDKFFFVEDRLFHAAYLRRSTQGSILLNTLNRHKYKIELGKPVNPAFLPEVFSSNRPKIVPVVTQKRSLIYLILAILITPIKILKRILANHQI